MRRSVGQTLATSLLAPALITPIVQAQETYDPGVMTGPPAPQSAGLPKWVWPVIIGGGVLLFFLLKKKRR